MDPSLSSDAELIAAIADGDRAGELYERHQPWLTARLRHRCADLDVVAEAVQDTFVAVWRGAGRWSGAGEPTAWIWGDSDPPIDRCLASSVALVASVEPSVGCINVDNGRRRGVVRNLTR